VSTGGIVSSDCRERYGCRAQRIADRLPRAAGLPSDRVSFTTRFQVLGQRPASEPGEIVATVHDARAESPTARTLVLDVPAWPGHVAGQHVDVRLTAEEGYQAQRSYSIASGRCDHACRTGAHALS
jgi:hypothetical protein